jgi:hypothetical protein
MATAGKDGDGARNVVGIALAAIGGGIGVLGFVAFFGAAILWVRMEAVKVPANEAIAVMPKSVLVTTGASFLVLPVLLAVVLLGALYLVAWVTDYESRALYLVAWVTDYESRKKNRWIEWARKGIRPVSIAIVLFIAAAPAVLFSAVGLPAKQLALIAAAVIGLSAICLAILTRTNFIWFAPAIIIAVVLLNGVVIYCRIKNDPKVEPAALLRSNGAPVFGYFIAQTSDRVYIATRIPTSAMRLDAIPREEVTDLTIADLESKGDAYPEARQLALAICRVARERAKTGQAAAAGPGKRKATESCTLADLRRLRSSAPKNGGTPAA